MAIVMTALLAGPSIAQGEAKPEPPSDWTLYVTGGLPPPGMQYLYGSGEAAAASVQSYNALVSYVSHLPKRPKRSVMLAKGASLDAPVFSPCEGRKRAVVLDIDETVLLNLGAEEQDAKRPGWRFDEARWTAWEQNGAGFATPVPGVAAAFAELRKLKVTIILNSNHATATADGTIKALKAAGLGDFESGKTLYLLGDEGSSAKDRGKDSRRAAVARTYCVVAMVGDQLGDFSDAFDGQASTKARRAATTGAISNLWGSGWFMLPNPVYGKSLKGGYEIFENGDGGHWDPEATIKQGAL
jgi:5'-nucleotidase (lipoprotein e(P4) family)